MTAPGPPGGQRMDPVPVATQLEHRTETAASAHIRIRDARVSFTRADGANVDALAGVDLEVERSEFVCIIGRSGEGKTTLLNAVAGLVPLSAGEVLVDDRPVTKPGADRGVIFQADSVFPWMRVLANVEFGLRIRGIPRRPRREVAMEHLRLVGLAAHGNIAIQFLQGCGWSRGRMRPNCNLYSIAAQFVKPLLRDPQLGRRAAPEKI